MFTPPIRLALIAVALGLGAWQLLQGSPGGAVFLAAAALLAWGYFRHGTVHAALAALRRGDAERARKVLERTPDPTKLTAQDRAYYHWLRGMLLAQDGQLEAARAEFRSALEERLRTEHDRALVHCQLAALAAQAGEVPEAREHLAKARELRHRSDVEALIQLIQKKLDLAA